MMPGNPVVGGSVLRRPAIQSPNFVQSPLAGWAVNADGTAYFASVTAQGSITANTVIVHGATGSVLVYSGTPAAGNLIAAIGGSAGTDSFGNSWAEGITVGPSGSPQVLLLPAPGGPGSASEIQLPVNSVPTSNTPNISASTTGGVPELVTSGPAQAVPGDEDWVQTVMFANDTSGNEARMEFRYISTTGGTSVEGSFNGNGWTITTLAVTNLTVNGSSSTQTGALTDGTISGSSATGTLPNGGITGTSGAASAGTAHTHGGGSYSVISGAHAHNAGSYAVTNGTHQHVL